MVGSAAGNTGGRLYIRPSCCSWSQCFSQDRIPRPKDNHTSCFSFRRIVRFICSTETITRVELFNIYLNFFRCFILGSSWWGTYSNLLLFEHLEASVRSCAGIYSRVPSHFNWNYFEICVLKDLKTVNLFCILRSRSSVSHEIFCTSKTSLSRWESRRSWSYKYIC